MSRSKTMRGRRQSELETHLVSVARSIAGLGVVLGMLFTSAPARALPPLPVLHTVCGSGCEFTTIEEAVADGLTKSGDSIEVMPGTYSEQVTVSKKLEIFGASGQTRPVITSAGESFATVKITTGGAGSTLTHLDIRATGSYKPLALDGEGAVIATDLALTSTSRCVALGPSSRLANTTVTTTPGGHASECVSAVGPDVAVTDSTVEAPGEQAMGLSQGILTDSRISGDRALALSGTTVQRSTLDGVEVGVEAYGSANRITDSVVTATAPGGSAIVAGNNDPDETSLALRNVTAVASGSGSFGLWAPSSSSPLAGARPNMIDGRNVISRGAGADVEAGAAESSCPTGEQCLPGNVTLGYSNFVTTAGPVDTSTVGHNQSGDPLFVNPIVGAGQDFHIASAASPLIGAGVEDGLVGLTDRDGVAHPNPPSIGAYEFTGPPAAAIGPAGIGGSPGAGTLEHAGLTPDGGPSAAAVLASISGETLSPEAFLAAPSGPSAVPAKRHYGTEVGFTLNQPARVRFTALSLQPGRRGSRGSCVKPTRVNGSAARCTRLIAVPGALRRLGTTGLNGFRFTGRLAGRRLAPGNYVLVATPSAGGMIGPAARHAFTVIHR